MRFPYLETSPSGPGLLALLYYRVACGVGPPKPQLYLLHRRLLSSTSLAAGLVSEESVNRLCPLLCMFHVPFRASHLILSHG